MTKTFTKPLDDPKVREMLALIGISTNPSQKLSQL